MAKFTAKQIRRFYALRKAKLDSKLKEKLREDNANDVLEAILLDSLHHLILASKNFNDPMSQDNIRDLTEGISNLLDKLESKEIKIVFNKKPI